MDGSGLKDDSQKKNRKTYENILTTLKNIAHVHTQAANAFGIFLIRKKGVYMLVSVANIELDAIFFGGFSF